MLMKETHAERCQEKSSYTAHQRKKLTLQDEEQKRKEQAKECLQRAQPSRHPQLLEALERLAMEKHIHLEIL